MKFDPNDPLIPFILAITEAGGKNDNRRKEAEAKSQQEDDDDENKLSGKKEKIIVNPVIPNLSNPGRM
jgi:hypothetical protein